MTGMQAVNGNNSAFKGVTMKPARREKGKVTLWRKKRWWLLSFASVLVIVIAVMTFLNTEPAYTEAPEAQQILSVQEGLNFGILIPSYMPKGFDRNALEIKVVNSGPSGEPVVNLTYRNKRKSAAIFLRQWVPGNPEMETLNKSVPIETQWGQGWLMTQGGNSGIGSLWVTIGQLRADVTSSNLSVVSPEQILQMANTLGLASQEQTYTFKMDPVVIKGVAPPPPFEVPINSDGVQELNLTITPGGYQPIRFLVKKDVPVKVNFRAVGEVGCGSDGVLTMPDGNNLPITSNKKTPLTVLEFTPKEVGDFQYYCSSYCYRGVMLVRE